MHLRVQQAHCLPEGAPVAWRVQLSCSSSLQTSSTLFSSQARTQRGAYHTLPGTAGGPDAHPDAPVESRLGGEVEVRPDVVMVGVDLEGCLYREQGPMSALMLGSQLPPSPLIKSAALGVT